MEAAGDSDSDADTCIPIRLWRILYHTIPVNEGCFMPSPYNCALSGDKRIKKNSMLMPYGRRL